MQYGFYYCKIDNKICKQKQKKRTKKTNSQNNNKSGMSNKLMMNNIRTTRQLKVRNKMKRVTKTKAKMKAPTTRKTANRNHHNHNWRLKTMPSNKCSSGSEGEPK